LVPVAHLLPTGHFLGVAAIELAAIVVLLLVLLVLGVFARSTLGRGIGDAIERMVLSKFPGYQIVKSIATGFPDSRDETVLRAALVSFDDNPVHRAAEPATSCWWHESECRCWTCRPAGLPRR
jgi:hypothetical protein